MFFNYFYRLIIMKKHNGTHYSIGRKIPPEYENPLDDILLDLCDDSINFCIDNKITPNAITLFRIVLGAFIIYHFNYSCDIYIPVVGTLLFYWLDCLDGHLARATDQVTVIGDYLDHGADAFFFIGMIISILYKKYTYKTYIFIIIIIFGLLLNLHIGLQQKHYNALNQEIRQENNLTNSNNKKIIIDDIDNELLDNINRFHNFDKTNIKWTKYFGSGTFVIILSIIIYFIQTHVTCKSY
jgi:hypothetical protein